MSAEHKAAWKPIALILAILLALGALIYPFMEWRVEQLELECAKGCANKGFRGYLYSPPRGARSASQGRCECANPRQ